MPNIVVQYWGRRGAGPLFFYHTVSALKSIDAKVFITNASWIELDMQLLNHCFIDQQASFARIGQAGYLLTLLLAPYSLYSFVRFLLKHKIDLVFCPMANPFSPLLGFVLNRLNIPYLVIIHDANPHPGESTFFSRWLSRATLRWGSAYIVLSNDVREQIASNLQTAGKPIYQVAHGPLFLNVRAEPRELALDKTYRLLFLGRIRAYKGLSQFIEMVQRLRQTGYPVVGVVAGDGPVSIEEQQVLGTSEDFEFHHHWLSEAEMGQFLSEADLAILPYQEASQSGIIAAAQSYGLPCVVAPVGGIVDQVADGQTGIVARSVHVDDLVVATRRILDDPSLYKTISEKMLFDLENNRDWEAMAECVVQYAQERKGQ